MLTKDYADMISELHRFEVDYVVVGAYAMSIFGYTRSTGDIDILTTITGVSFDSIQIEHHTTDGLEIPYTNLKSLIKNKRSTGQLRELADCEELKKRL